MNRLDPNHRPAAAGRASVPGRSPYRLCAERLRCAPGRLRQEVDFSLSAGEVLQIEGANGSGKTTLLRAVCGLIVPEAGRVSWNDIDIAEDPEPLRRALTFIGHAAGVKRDLTPRENLRAARAIAGDASRDACSEALERVGLDGRADVPLRRLSAGQVRRVSLARLLLRRNPLWVLDEPFSALDRPGKALLEELIIAHCGAGGMVLLTTHQPADLGPLSVRTLVLEA